MFGDWENEFNKGIVPLALAQIFETIEKDSEYNYKLTLSCMQIYMEMVFFYKTSFIKNPIASRLIKSSKYRPATSRNI